MRLQKCFLRSLYSLTPGSLFSTWYPPLLSWRFLKLLSLFILFDFVKNILHGEFFVFQWPT